MMDAGAQTEDEVGFVTGMNRGDIQVDKLNRSGMYVTYSKKF